MVVRSWQILPPSTLGISQVSLRLNTCSGTAHRTRSSPSEQVPGIEVVHLTQQPNQSTSTILRPTTAGFFLPNFHGVCEIKGKKQMYKKKKQPKPLLIILKSKYECMHPRPPGQTVWRCLQESQHVFHWCFLLPCKICHAS